jgi:hypothetical protein
MQHSWICRCCGKQYNDLLLDVAFDVPGPWHALTEAEREARGMIDSDRCSIDEDFFVRGCIEIPIIDLKDVFRWGVWVSVSKPNFKLILDLWDEEIRSDQPPIFGWLCNEIRDYPTTSGLKTLVYLRNDGIRPSIKLEPTDHPLAIEQREGITLQRVEEIVAAGH